MRVAIAAALLYTMRERLHVVGIDIGAGFYGSRAQWFSIAQLTG